MIRLALSVAMFAGLSYLVFFVHLGDKPLFAHLQEIWRAPVVQRKVELLKREAPKAAEPIRRALREAPFTQVPQEPAPKPRPTRDPEPDLAAPTEADRRSLDRLVHRVQHSR